MLTLINATTMAFYTQDEEMSRQLNKLINRFGNEGRPGLHDSIAITWVRYRCSNPEACSGLGASWGEKQLIYPASVIKLFYAVAIEAWIQKDLLQDNTELRRALKDMIADSSNDATSLIVDLLSGTTSGPSLHGDSWKAWKAQRQLVNKWLASLKWPELTKVNCCQKTWADNPYGREKDFYGEGNYNRNALTTLATARLLESVMTNSLISPNACTKTKKLLARSLDINQRKANTENQIDGFIGEGLEKGSRLWSKAGLMSQARHDAAWIALPGRNPMLLIIFTQGRQRANDKNLLPALANELSKENSNSE